MSSLKAALLLLLLAAVTTATPGTEDCDGVKKLSTSNLHEVSLDPVWIGLDPV